MYVILSTRIRSSCKQIVDVTCTEPMQIAMENFLCFAPRNLNNFEGLKSDSIHGDTKISKCDCMVVVRVDNLWSYCHRKLFLRLDICPRDMATDGIIVLYTACLDWEVFIRVHRLIALYYLVVPSASLVGIWIGFSPIHEYEVALQYFVLLYLWLKLFYMCHIQIR